MVLVPRPPIDDPWVRTSKGTPITLLSALVAPLTPHYWNYNYDDAAFWVRTSARITTLQFPIGGGYPFKPPYWKYNYDDAAFWVGSPNRWIPPLEEPAGGGFPFKPPYWKYNNDDPGIWVGGKSVPVFPPNIPITFHITATDILELPVDYFLMGDPLNLIDEVKEHKKPSFTVKSNKKGYN